MRMLGTLDLEILQLAVDAGGTFDENDMASSDLKRLGVGRILDALASLRDRRMILQNGDGTFAITDLAMGMLWDGSIPMWVRILRLLRIKPCSAAQIAGTIGANKPLEGVMEDLRRRQFVLMSPQRHGSDIVRTYEILPEGADWLDRTEGEGFELEPPSDVQSALESICELVEKSSMSRQEKDRISALADGLRRDLGSK